MTLAAIQFSGLDYWELYPKVTFDGENKLIYVVPEITELNVKTDIYSAWKNWALVRDNLKWAAAFRVVGGDPISLTVSLGSTFFLTNGWRIKPWRGKYALNINGNLYTEEGDSPYVNADEPSAVSVLSARSNLIDEVGVLNPSTPTDVADAVWNTNTSNYNSNTFGGLLTNLHSSSIIATGSVLSGSTNIKLETSIIRDTHYYNGMSITIIDSNANNVITRVIDQSYNNGQIALVGALPFIPSAGSSIIILAPHFIKSGGVNVVH